MSKSTRPFALRTRNDYPLDECISSVQKCIRRGLLDEAMFWSAELYLSGYDWYLWRRLLIIASEDVGPAWPEGPAVVRALFENWKESRSKPGHSSFLFIAHTLVLLCRSPKTRVVDHVARVHLLSHDDDPRPIPDVARDKHTAAGRAMGRGIDHFLDEGARVENEAPDPDKDRYEALERQLVAEGRKVPSRSKAGKPKTAQLSLEELEAEDD
jgi:replication-associated recombination protein RarA